jgi:hypothetical protein
MSGKSSSQFGAEFLLLQQEGYLFRCCLTEGLTALRNSNLHDIGRYYVAFFQLSNGLERLLKVIVIIEYAATHGLTFPPNTLLRKIGHDLLQLVTKVRSVQNCLPTQSLAFLIPGSIEWEIVEHFNEFARGARYFNLDTLTAGTIRVDPLRRWNLILERIIAAALPAVEHATAAAQPDRPERSQDAGLLVPLEIVSQARAWQEYFERGRLYEQGAGYAAYRVLLILDGLRDVLYEVTSAAHALERHMGVTGACVPWMAEFLSFVEVEDCQLVINKKRWP